MAAVVCRKRSFLTKEELAIQHNKAQNTAERLQLALESSDSGVWEIDVQSRTIEFDNRIRELLGLEVDGNTATLDEWNDFLKEIFVGEDYKKSVPLQDLNNPLEFVLYNVKNDTYIHCSSKPVMDSEGNVIKRIGMTTDVTEREQMLTQLEGVKETFNIALQSSNAGYWEIPFNHDGEYVMHYEENFSKLFKIGHTRPFTTTEWSDYLKPILDPVEYKDFHNFLRNFDENVDRVVMDAHLCFTDGSETYIKNSAQVSYDRHGKPEKMIGLCVDLTKQTKSLETASEISQTLLNSMRQMIYVADIDTDEVIFVNDVMQEAFHVESNYYGKKYWELFAECNIESVNEAKKKLDVDPDGAVSWEMYQPYLKKELSCVARYITWIDGRTVCFRTYFDVSSLKQAERSIQEQLKQQKLMAEIARDFI